MARPIETYLILDTETGGSLANPIVYDFGYIIINRKGEELARFSSAVKEIITDPKLMMNAFYAKKIFSFYIPKIAKGDLELNSWSDIVAQLLADVEKYNVKTICAYNAKFDCRAIKETNSFLGFPPVFKSPIRILCLWEAACETLMNNRNFKKVARDLGWVTAKGNIRTSAEMAYRYVSKDYDFIESHTAIEDAEIETVLLETMLNKKVKLPYNFSGRTWQLVNKKAKNEQECRA